MTTTIRSNGDGSKSYIAVGGTDRVTIDAATGKLTSTYSPPTGERSLALATMQKFEDEFGASIAGVGYQKLPSGLIIQWGGNAFTSVGASVTFPIAFPNSVYHIVFGVYSPSPQAVSYGTDSVTGFKGCCSVTTGVRWLAIGY